MLYSGNSPRKVLQDHLQVALWRKPNIDELDLTPGEEKKDGGSFVDDMNT